MGKLVTNRVGRIEFAFDPLFNEYFEREHYAIVREMPYSPQDYEVHRALQAVNLDDPPLIKRQASRADWAWSRGDARERRGGGELRGREGMKDSRWCGVSSTYS